MSNDTSLTRERADLLETLAAPRTFLRHTVDGLTDEQARDRPTASQLCLGGLVKHVAQTEERWAAFIVEGPSAMDMNEESFAEREAGFVLGADETLASVLDRYAEVAARTDELVRSVGDLDAAHPLPDAPWFPPDTTRSVRRVFQHIAMETAHHAGHADILRETIDGQKTMG